MVSPEKRDDTPAQLGVYAFELDGVDLELPVTFKATKFVTRAMDERLYPLVRRINGLDESGQPGKNVGDFSPEDLANIIHAGLASAGDTRRTVDEYGEMIMRSGVATAYTHVSIYLIQLMNGGTSGKKNPAPPTKD